MNTVSTLALFLAIWAWLMAGVHMVRANHRMHVLTVRTKRLENACRPQLIEMDRGRKAWIL